jgi:hypothetical protein
MRARRRAVAEHQSRRVVAIDGDYLFVAVRGDRIVATRRYSTAVPR